MDIQGKKEINFKDRRILLKSLAMIMSLPLCHRLTYATILSDVVSFKAFVQYIEKIFGFNHLNVDMSREIYELIQNEPWGMNHLSRVFNKSSGVSGEHLLAQLDEGEHWFLEHLLTTWLTGIYYHNRMNIVVSYEYALMHEALVSIRPVPGISTETFGFWHQPPQGMSSAL